APVLKGFSFLCHLAIAPVELPLPLSHGSSSNAQSLRTVPGHNSAASWHFLKFGLAILFPPSGGLERERERERERVRERDRDRERERALAPQKCVNPRGQTAVCVLSLSPRTRLLDPGI